MKSTISPKIASEILGIVKDHPKLGAIMKNVDPTTIDPNPWLSNFTVVQYSEDPNFCDKITGILNEGKSALFVAIMRSVDDPENLINKFHPIHVDSRFSDKTLMVLDGDPNYQVFSKTEWKDFTYLEKYYIRVMHIILFLIEKLRLSFLQGVISHRLPNVIKRKVYKNFIYKNIVTGEKIKFNNMLPHHSHPQPTKYSLLLQVVYD